MTKGTITRERIIAAAAPIFNRRGFEGASITEILDATGLEKGGLYRHFSSKEELAVASLRYALANSVKLRTEGLDQVANSGDKLRYAIRRFIEGPSIMPGGCPLMNTAIDSDDGNPALYRLARKGVRDWKSRLLCIVEDGMEAGEIRAGIEPRRIANTIVAILEGALMISRMEGNRQALEDAQESLDILIRDIETQADGSKPTARTRKVRIRKTRIQGATRSR